MTMIAGQETAKIYQFPVKGRPANASRRAATRPAIGSAPTIASDFGSGWYHDAAMRESPQGQPH